MAMENGEQQSQGIQNRKDGNFPEWYAEVVQKARLADYAPIAGCMVIRPDGYAIWEKIQAWFDRKIKETGHRDAYFPLFIPESFLKKEAEHFSGFTPEVAYVDKVEKTDSGAEERYALRPTSETIIYDSFSKWIRSWRDLPMLVNQWCNIVRWETKATRLFLRTREFLWQEGHTAHRTAEEADKEVMDILKLYQELMETQLAIPAIPGKKPEEEKFAGAVYTSALEALMPDGKALQMATSHNLGQNFSKPFGIKFKDKDEKENYVWQTSWGFSTRLIGSIVMVHGDDKGLVLPPRIAPIQIVVVPIIFEKQKKAVFEEAEKIKKALEADFSVKLDAREEYSAGWKFHEWEMMGIPLRIEIGPKDMEKKQVLAVRRDTGEKTPIKFAALKNGVSALLEEIQESMFRKAKKFLKENTVEASSFSEFEQAIKGRKMVKANWCGGKDCSAAIKEKTAATIRLIPLKAEKAGGKCVRCASKAKHVVYFARAY
jgi:prolyl-tRNA synthetase